MAGKFGEVMLKQGASKELASELLGLYTNMITGAQSSLKTSMDEGMKALRAEHQDKFDERMEAVKRMIPGIFKSDEEKAFFNETGLGDHPGFLSIMLRLAPLAMADSSFFEQIPRGGGEISRDAAKAELADIMTNPENKMHAGYKANDKKVMDHIRELYVRALGQGTTAADGSLASDEPAVTR